MISKKKKALNKPNQSFVVFLVLLKRRKHSQNQASGQSANLENIDLYQSIETIVSRLIAFLYEMKTIFPPKKMREESLISRHGNVNLQLQMYFFPSLLWFL
jgi:hypothetical protein